MSTPQLGEMIAEGKAKKIYATSDPDKLIFYFKDDATAFNAKKRGTIASKGILNNRISQHFFRLLESHGIATHFVAEISEREMLVRRLQIIQIFMQDIDDIIIILASLIIKRLGDQINRLEQILALTCDECVSLLECFMFLNSREIHLSEPLPYFFLMIQPPFDFHWGVIALDVIFEHIRQMVIVFFSHHVYKAIHLEADFGLHHLGRVDFFLQHFQFTP